MRSPGKIFSSAELAKLRDLGSELIGFNGRMKLLPAEHYKQYKPEELIHFGHKYARYGFPTEEVVAVIKKLIDGRKAIEIGSGHGDLGYHLGIPMTDSKIQRDPDIALTYKMMGQPTIDYPEDVRKFDAIDAIYHYKPKVVVSSWTTVYSPKDVPEYASSPYGIREEKLLDLVEMYILVGNSAIHGDKPIMERPHTVIIEDFIISRASCPEQNRIWIWSKK